MNTNSAISDSLKVNQNEDGSFTLEWDKNDPQWKFLNDLTSKEIQTMIEQAVETVSYTHLTLPTPPYV